MVDVIITRGLPASGKSTWCKKMIDENPNIYKRVNRDLLREMLDNNIEHIYFDNKSERFILKIRDSIILAAIENGKNVIVDDLNLSTTHINRISNIIKGKANLIIKDFTDVSVEECIARDLKRNKSVGEKIIRQMYNQFLKPIPPKVEYVDGLINVVICDLDGTLSLLNGRSPHDASTCDNDGLNTVVYNLIKNENVIFVSGREDKFRMQTESFLNKHNVNYISLFMRKTDDFRKDSIIKQEIYDDFIKAKYNIKFVLDDRNQTVDMWRCNGLTCLQVAEGDF